MVIECQFKALFLFTATTALIELMDGVRVPTKISKDVAKSVCQLRTRFAKLEVLEEPIRSRYRPSSPLRCGWYSFGNCVAIDPYLVLTAAHCTAGAHEDDITLEAGRHNLDDRETMAKQVVRGVRQINEHLRFNNSPETRHRYDICMLKLYEKSKLQLTEYVEFVGFANTGYNATGVGTLVGWGKRNNGLPLGRLQEVNLTIISDLDCRKIYGTNVTKKDICAYDFGKSGCFGDSGGPFYQNISGETRVIGIQRANGAKCSLTDAPTIFVEISYYSKWILRFLKKIKP